MNDLKLPEISRLSPYNPGDTLQIFGENLLNSKVFLWHPPVLSSSEISDEIFKQTVLPEIPPEDATKLEVLKSFKQVIFAHVDYIEPGCAVVWVLNEAGYSAPKLANKPEVWLRSLESCVAGDRISFYGQNFASDDFKKMLNTKGFLKNNKSGQIFEMQWRNSQDLTQFMPGQNDHKIEFILPESLPHGDYEVTFSNGTGGKWGFTKPLPLEILNTYSLVQYCQNKWNFSCRSTATFDFSFCKIIKIPIEFGDGITDATGVLQGAIDEVANSGGGMVILPAGRFGITEMLELKQNVVLNGSGMGATTITVLDGKALKQTGMPNVVYASRKNNATQWAVDWKPFLDRVKNTPMIWIQSKAGIENLKIEGKNGSQTMVLIGTSDGSVSESVFFNFVEIDNKMNSAMLNTDFDVTYHGILGVGFTKDLTLYKCKLTAANPLALLPAQNNRLRLIGNDFEVSPRQVCDNVFITGVYDSIIEENTFKYGRRTLMCQQGFSNNWVFQNRSEGVANTTNANEEYMSEYGFSLWAGNANEVNEDSIKVSFDIGKKTLSHGGGNAEDNLCEHKWILMIMSGRGYGQYRLVSGIKGNKIYLDSPWDVLPDSTTYFNLVTVTKQNLWICNYAGIGSGISQFSYLASVENVIAGHQMILASGISMYAMEMERDDSGEVSDLGVCAFNQIINCDARYSGIGLCVWTNQSYSTIRDKQIEVMNIFGNIIRWNSFIGGADKDYVKNQSVWYPVDVPSAVQLVGDYNVIEKNLFSGYEVGLHLRKSSMGNFVSSNKYKTSKNVLDEGKDTFILSDSNSDFNTQK